MLFFCISTEAQAFAVGTSAQKANLIALTKALELSQGKHVNIYTDFTVVHAHGPIWKERRLLTSGNKDIKHAKEKLKQLDAVNLSKQMTRCTAQDTRRTFPNKPGKPTAVKTARQAATSWGLNSPPGLART